MHCVHKVFGSSETYLSTWILGQASPPWMELLRSLAPSAEEASLQVARNQAYQEDFS